MINYTMKYVQDSDENDILYSPILQGKDLYNALAHAAIYAISLDRFSFEKKTDIPDLVAKRIIEQHEDAVKCKNNHNACERKFNKIFR